MNNPKDYTKTKSENWKKTVERYRQDMLNLAKQNEIFSRPKPPQAKPMPLPESPVDPDVNEQRLREEQELGKLFDRIKDAREELERLEAEKRELERLVEQQREQIRPRPQPRSDVKNDADYWAVENMRRLPNSIPVPERELPFNNSSVVLPPPNEGPGNDDNEIIDFDREPAEWEMSVGEDEFNQPAVFAQTTADDMQIDITESNSSSTPNGDRILRPDYRTARVDEPVKQLEKMPTDMQNTPRDRFDTSLLTGTADLIVQVFTARQALPITEATVTVSRVTSLQGGREVVAVHITDENGKTPAIPLPTPPQYLSETPGNSHPYSEYTVDVKKKGYYDNTVRGIQMFDSITTVEPVNLIPLPAGQNDGSEQFDISDYEL